MPLAAAPDLPNDFYPAWVSALTALGINPLDVMRVGFSETGLHPGSANGAGLIGFVPSTLRALGWTGTPQEFGQLSATQQVPYVAKYYAPYASRVKSDALAYVVNFTPAYLNEALAGGDDYVIAAQGDPKRGWIYSNNTILDRNHDGQITVGDLKQHLLIQDVGPRYQAIEAQMKQTIADLGGDPNLNHGGAIAGIASSKYVKVAAYAAVGATALWYLNKHYRLPYPFPTVARTLKLA